MTRRSKRELERAIDELDDQNSFSIQKLMWASLKDYHDGRLSPAEQRLLENHREWIDAAADSTEDKE